MKRRAVTFCAVWLALSLGQAATLMPAAMPVVSRTAGGPSFAPQISADGTHVVFLSEAQNLTANFHGGPPHVQVFLRNLVTSNTVLITTNLLGAPSNGDAFSAVLSSNGQFIAFASAAPDLVTNDTNAASDVFLWNRTDGKIRLISGVGLSAAVAFDHTPNTNQLFAGHPLISADGRYVFFESLATNLTALADTNLWTDIFRRDTWSNRTVLVSIGLSNEVANAPSELASISADGAVAAFLSRAGNLALSPPGQPITAKVYVRQLVTSNTVCASSNVDAQMYAFGLYHRCFNPALNDSGTVVAFTAPANNGEIWVARHDLQTNGTTVLTKFSRTNSFPTVSADGRFVAYNRSGAIYRWDTGLEMEQLVSEGPATGEMEVVAGTPDGLRFIYRDSLSLSLRDMAESSSQTILTRAPSARLDFFGLSADAALSQLAFEADDSNLVADDRNQTSDVFLWRTNSGITLLSEIAPGLTNRVPAMANSIGLNSISADGDVIVFGSDELRAGVSNTSQALIIRRLSSNTFTVLPDTTNIVSAPVVSRDGRFVAYIAKEAAGGEIGLSAVLRYDTLTGTNEFATVRTNGAPWWDVTLASPPSMSSNGQISVFESMPARLVSGVTSLVSQIILRDLLAGTNEIVSRSSTGTIGNSPCTVPLLTANGRWVLFLSAATNLDTNAAGGEVKLFARDLWNGQTRLLSPPSETALSPFALSENGRFVLFRTFGVYRHDLETGNTSALENEPPFTARIRLGNISDDGTAVYGFRSLGVFPYREEVRVRTVGGALETLGTNWNGYTGEPGWKRGPQITRDGRFVVYQQSVVIQVGGPFEYVRRTQITVHDRLLGVNFSLSTNALGAFGNEMSGSLQLSPDGRTVVFQSFANDLMTGDYNNQRDVFVLKLGSADSDGDGLDDDWEVAYFLNLSRNGSGDDDGDGVSDRDEFLAGTAPTNAGSVFRVLTVTPAGGGAKLLFWSGNPERSYRAEFKDDLGAASWTTLTGTITWSGSTASITDPTAGSSTNRYYRIVRLP